MTTIVDASRFLQAVFPDYGPHAIFAFSHAPSGMVHVRDLASLDGSRDCYWSVASFPDDQSAKRVLTRALDVRALVIDDVGTKVPAHEINLLLGGPTAVIETSKGNFQWTYRLATPVPVDQWAGFFAQIERRVGMKLEGRDAVHLFRLPLGVNTKPGRGGFAPRLTQLNSGIELRNAPVAGVNASSTLPGSGSSGSGPGPSTPEPRIRDIRGIVILVPNNLSTHYDEWVARAHQIKALALDETEAAAAFDEFSSRRADKYDTAETVRVWNSLHSVSRTKGLTLLRDAEAADPAAFAKIMNAEAGSAFDDGVDHSSVPVFSGGGYSITHVDMAAHIVKVHRDDMGWMSNAPGHWAAFDPVLRRWEIEPHDRFMRTAVREEIFNVRAQLIASGNTKGLKVLNEAKWQGAVQSLLVRHGELLMPFEKFDADLDMFGVPGGVVRLTAGGVIEEPGDASQMVSRSTSVRPAPAGSKGVAWEKFLDDFTMGDPELRAWWQAFMGYCLTGRVHEHAVVFLYGPGGNGKSVFLDTVADVLGDYHSRSGHTLFMASNGSKHMAAVADLVGARLVTSPDVPVGCAWDLGLIKPLTGGGTFKAQFMRENWFKFTPQFKLILAGNEKPELGGVDNSIRRRFWLVPAMYVPKNINKQLSDVLKAERPAILRWMIEGWEMYNLGGLPSCTVIERETEDYLSEADVWGKWHRATLAKKKGDRTRHRITELWNMWDAYRAMEGSWKASPGHKNTFSTKLREAGYKVERDDKGAYVDELSVTKSASSVF
jgi:P4 family phage/plasmid primase-like protien